MIWPPPDFFSVFSAICSSLLCFFLRSLCSGLLGLDVLAADAELAALGVLVEHPRAAVHDEDGKGNALREAAEHADEHGQRAAADAVDDAAGSGDGAGAVVGRHEERAEQQAAGQEVVEHPLDVGVAAAVFAAEDERQQGDGADERHGDVPGDDLAAQQVHAADEQRERADFAEAAGHGAEEHGLISEVLRQRLAGLHVAERGGHGGRVRADDGRQAAGHDPGGHEQRVGGEQERTAGERRVEEVLADAAVELLDDHDGEERADDRQPPLAVGRQGVREQDARDHGGQVADGVGLFHSGLWTCRTSGRTFG